MFFLSIFSVLEITDYPYVVYKAFLKYLYTDRLDLMPEEAIGTSLAYDNLPSKSVTSLLPGKNM